MTDAPKRRRAQFPEPERRGGLVPRNDREARLLEALEGRRDPRSSVERGVRYATSGIGILLGVTMAAISLPGGSPLGIGLGVVVVVLGVLLWRAT